MGPGDIATLHAMHAHHQMAAQRQLETAFLLILNASRQVEMSNPGLTATQYATLAIGRRVMYMVSVGAEGKGSYVGEDQARQIFPQLTVEQRQYATSFQHWWNTNRREVRGWTAELMTGERVDEVELDQSEARSKWGYPVQEALKLLERLAAEGWRLVHVSEDHGLYAGADTHNEAYLTRVRYLLSRS